MLTRKPARTSQPGIGDSTDLSAAADFYGRRTNRQPAFRVSVANTQHTLRSRFHPRTDPIHLRPLEPEMTHPSATWPTTRAVVLNAVLVAVISVATVVGLGAPTGTGNYPTTPSEPGGPGVSYTITIPTPPPPAPTR